MGYTGGAHKTSRNHNWTNPAKRGSYRNQEPRRAGIEQTCYYMTGDRLAIGQKNRQSQSLLLPYGPTIAGDTKQQFSAM